MNHKKELLWSLWRNPSGHFRANGESCSVAAPGSKSVRCWGFSRFCGFGVGVQGFRGLGVEVGGCRLQGLRFGVTAKSMLGWGIREETHLRGEVLLVVWMLTAF